MELKINIDKLKTSYIVDDNDGDVYVPCPHCGHGETHPIHEQRHHLQMFDIYWMPDNLDMEEPEKCITICHVCRQQFLLIWKYSENK